MTNINDDYSAKLPEGAIATANADNALATVKYKQGRNTEV